MYNPAEQQRRKEYLAWLKKQAKQPKNKKGERVIVR